MTTHENQEDIASSLAKALNNLVGTGYSFQIAEDRQKVTLPRINADTANAMQSAFWQFAGIPAKITDHFKPGDGTVQKNRRSTLTIEVNQENLESAENTNKVAFNTNVTNRVCDNTSSTGVCF